MFVNYTLIGGMDANIVHTGRTAVSDATQHSYVLGQILLQWQSSAESRQAIIRSKRIPRLHTFDNGVQRLTFELERPDLKALFNLFLLPHNRRARVAASATEAEHEIALAELKAVYRLLKEIVRDEE